jgi:hypothetical protein
MSVLACAVADSKVYFEYLVGTSKKDIRLPNLYKYAKYKNQKNYA